MPRTMLRHLRINGYKILLMDIERKQDNEDDAYK